MFSTSLLHDILLPTKRLLVSVDDSANWIGGYKHLQHERHLFRHVRDHALGRMLDTIGREWDVVLIDYGSYHGRLYLLKELLPFSRIIVFHDYGDEESDSQWGQHGIHFSDVKEQVNSAMYKAMFTTQAPFTVVLSNFVDVEKEIEESISWR